MTRDLDGLTGCADELADRFEHDEPKPRDRGRVTPSVLRIAAYKRATGVSHSA